MIDMNIANFLERLPDNLARPARFVVKFNLPSGINESGSWVNNEATSGVIQGMQFALNPNGWISVLCFAATMPGKTFETYPHKQLNAPYNIPYSQKFDPVVFSFYTDEKLNTRKYFDIWQSAVANLTDNSMNFYNEYTADIFISQLDLQGNETYTIQLFNCFPIAIADQSYDASQRSSLQTVSVTMSYRLWRANHDTTYVPV